MPYRKLELATQDLLRPNTTPVRPGDFTDVLRAHEALVGLDTTINSARRVLLEAGLRGSSRFMVLDGAPTLSQFRTYPDTDTPRVVARATAMPLTPGYLVALELVALPSGPTQAPDDLMITWEEDDRSGVVELRVTYRNAAGDIALATASIQVDGSGEILGAEPLDPWQALAVDGDLAMPGPWAPDPVEWAKWTGIGVSVDLELRYRGSPRVLDVVAVERAWSSTVELSAPRRPAAFYTGEDGEPLELPASEYPIVRTSEADRALGAESIVEAIAETGAVLGPVLWSWSSHDEADPLHEIVEYDGGIGDGEALAVEVAGDTWTLLASTSVADVAAAPGLLTGNYAAGLRGSAAELLDTRAGVIPVWISAYWRTSNESAPAQLEVRASEWSEVSLASSSTAWAWTRVPAWLEVGPDPEARVAARVLWRCPGGTASLRDLVVSYRLH